MAKIKSVYICSECGHESPKWYGKCPSCGEWNTMNEEIKDTAKAAPAAKARSFSSYAKPLSIDEISTEDEHRYDTGSTELNRDRTSSRECHNLSTNKDLQRRRIWDPWWCRSAMHSA